MTEHIVQIDDAADLTDPADIEEAEQPAGSAFTGSVLIQLFDQDGNVKDERRGGDR